jgi:hypothetical protein
MSTQTTAAPPIQISVVLDSGVFLNEVYNETYPNCRIGYFAPEFRIYGDWTSIDGPDLTSVPPSSGSQMIEFRLIDASGEEKKDGVRLSEDFRKHLLLRKTIYKDEAYSPPVLDSEFEWVFNFNYGFFRCSSVKNRFFKQIDGRTHLPNNKRKEHKEIAHDVVIHYELAQDERLEIVVGDQVLWTTDGKGVTKRFDIEVIAPHATAENYFRDALDHKGNDYWLPNQGDPDPMGGRP